MNHAFGIQLIHRTGRMHFAGALGFFLILSITVSIAFVGVACGTPSLARQVESPSEGSDPNKIETTISLTDDRRIFRRFVGSRKFRWPVETEFRETASTRLALTRFRQISPSCEHDRNEGRVAPLRC